MRKRKCWGSVWTGVLKRGMCERRGVLKRGVCEEESVEYESVGGVSEEGLSE